MDLSTELASLYHAHHSQDALDVPFWLGLAEEMGSPVLELGCGSGRVSLALAEAGHRMYGLDKDPGMLAFFRNQIERHSHSRIHLLQADLTRFHLNCKFPLIILPCNTYSTLTPDERQSTLRCVTRHLQPGGYFAVSLPNPAALLELPPRGEAELETVFPHPRDGEPVQVSSSWRRSGRQLIFEWHYDHLLPDGQVKRHSMHIRQNLTPVDAYREEFQHAGLKIAFVYGDYNRSSYTPHAPHLILEATSQQVAESAF